MNVLVPLLIVVIIIGALLGGKNFGGVVRKGCGFLIFLVIIIIAAIVIFYSWSESKNSLNNQEPNSKSDYSAYFIVKDKCLIYKYPDIESDTIGHLEVGEKLFIKSVNKTNYF
jgi:hypothetical protein